MSWEYQRNDQKPAFELIPEGEHRVRVRSAEKAVSSKGRDMIVLQLDVSGYDSLLYYYIVFRPDRPEITNRTLTQFFDSFKNIKEGDCDLEHWIGKVGAVKVKHEEYNGETRAKVHYFIDVGKQEKLPPWREGESQEISPDIVVSDEDLPF